ncbi:MULTISPECIES: hypothetical protein [unclassified Bradyrhizobium]
MRNEQFPNRRIVRTRDQREEREAERHAQAEQVMVDHAAAQEAVKANRERLRALRLAHNLAHKQFD